MAGLVSACGLCGPGLAAGGRGTSYCANATGPASGEEPFFAGSFGFFSSPGDVVSSLVGILWGQGAGPPSRTPGTITSTICSGSGR